ncbi:hypothetical protein [Methylobacterium sp. A54F]
METVLILGAVAACVVAAILVAASAARTRRPPLRMGSELEEADEAALLRTVARPESPIDRDAEVIEVRRPEADRPRRTPRDVLGPSDGGI